MVRKGDWKLIYTMQAPHQLFDLSNDPEELDDLAEARPEVVAELAVELRKICDPDRENRRAHAFERRQIEAIKVAGYKVGEAKGAHCNLNDATDTFCGRGDHEH
jgi:choline-sulfatase